MFRLSVFGAYILGKIPVKDVMVSHRHIFTGGSAYAMSNGERHLHVYLDKSERRERGTKSLHVVAGLAAKCRAGVESRFDTLTQIKSTP